MCMCVGGCGTVLGSNKFGKHQFETGKYTLSSQPISITSECP